MGTTPNTALLVIDMQNFFLSMTGTCLPNVIALSRHFTAKNWPQIFTQHGHPASDFEEPITNQLVRKWGVDGALRSNTEDWELLPQIKELIKECKQDLQKDVEHKNVYDAFVGTDLEDRLRGMDIQRVVVVGVMTDCCCDSTARSAFNRGFETWMVSDATGSVDKVQHEAGLKAWVYGYGDVINTDEVIRRLG
jgi:nicotinamidase-related amidase